MFTIATVNERGLILYAYRWSGGWEPNRKGFMTRYGNFLHLTVEKDDALKWESEQSAVEFIEENQFHFDGRKFYPEPIQESN